MESHKIAIKLFVAKDDFAPDHFVPVFHRWIQRQDFPGHLLIDVADYAHVQGGPGTVLVASEANFYMDRAKGRLGLLYSRKLPLPGTFADRLVAVLKPTFTAAARLESEESNTGRLLFNTSEISIRINDRLLAPATMETFAAIKDDLQAVGKKLFADKPFTVEPQLTPGAMFEATLKSPGAPPLNVLLDRLG
jgi:hypothetical protein